MPTFEHVRDRAIFEIHMATAFPIDTVRAMPLAALNRITGEVEVVTKGGKVMQGKIDPKALGAPGRRLPTRTPARWRPSARPGRAHGTFP
jgi:site-specific recombinase XerC